MNFIRIVWLAQVSGQENYVDLPLKRRPKMGDLSFRLRVVWLTSRSLRIETSAAHVYASFSQPWYKKVRYACIYFVLSATHQAKAVRKLTQHVRETTSEVSERDVCETSSGRNDRPGLRFGIWFGTLKQNGGEIRDRKYARNAGYPNNPRDPVFGVFESRLQNFKAKWGWYSGLKVCTRDYAIEQKFVSERRY